MSEYSVKLPRMGESVEEATITRWLKKVGDTIDVDEPLVEVATDKVDSDLPSEVKGVIKEIRYSEEEVVPVGEILAVIEVEGLTSKPTAIEQELNLEQKKKDSPKNTSIEIDTQKELDIQLQRAQELIQNPNKPNRFYSPLVKSIIQKENISDQELNSIIGTGKDGRVTKNDILSFLSKRKSIAGKPSKESSNGQIEPLKDILPSQTSINTYSPGQDQLIELSRMQKMTAAHMRHSLANSAHVQSFVEVDVTDLWEWRERKKDNFLKETNQKLTFTPMLIHCLVKALKDYPVFNSTKEEDKLRVWRSINVGMATALPNGNLIVPVIKNAGNLHFEELVAQVNYLANSARNNNLSPDDIVGGTYTITNVGNYGTLMGTPIINQPQVGILAVGTIRKVPAVIETPKGDFIGIRKKLILSHSYDHQIVNGATGSLFAKRVADYLENWDLNHL